MVDFNGLDDALNAALVARDQILIELAFAVAELNPGIAQRLRDAVANMERADQRIAYERDKVLRRNAPFPTNSIF